MNEGQGVEISPNHEKTLFSPITLYEGDNSFEVSNATKVNDSKILETKRVQAVPFIRLMRSQDDKNVQLGFGLGTAENGTMEPVKFWEYTNQDGERGRSLSNTSPETKIGVSSVDPIFWYQVLKVMDSLGHHAFDGRDWGLIPHYSTVVEIVETINSGGDVKKILGQERNSWDMVLKRIGNGEQAAGEKHIKNVVPEIHHLEAVITLLKSKGVKIDPTGLLRVRKQLPYSETVRDVLPSGLGEGIKSTWWRLSKRKRSSINEKNQETISSLVKQSKNNIYPSKSDQGSSRP